MRIRRYDLIVSRKDLVCTKVVSDRTHDIVRGFLENI